MGRAASRTTINSISSGGTEVGFTTNNGANINFLRSAGGGFTSLSIGDPAGMANGVNSHSAVVGVPTTAPSCSPTAIRLH